MKFIDFSKKLLLNYFVIVTGITVAIALMGLNFYPDASLGYDAYFSPLILGAVATLPSYVFYSKKELAFRQMLYRRIFHFILLELVLLGFGYSAGLLTNIYVTLMFMVSIFAVYLFKMVVNWVVDSRTAMDINEGLKRIQE